MIKELNPAVIQMYVKLANIANFLIIEELRARGAPLVRKYGNPSIRKKIGHEFTVRTYVRTSVHPIDISQSQMWHSS